MKLKWNDKMKLSENVTKCSTKVIISLLISHLYLFLYHLDRESKNTLAVIELEKRVSLSDDAYSSRQDSNDMNGCDGSVVINNIKEKQSNNQAFKFKHKSKNGRMSHNPDVLGRNSLSGASSSSFIDTDNRNSMHIFAPVNNLGGVEASEIAKNANENSDMTSVQRAFNQVSSVLESGKFRFNKNKRQQSGKIDFDAIKQPNTGENILFNKVNKNLTLRSQNKHIKHLKVKKLKSDVGDDHHPYMLNGLQPKIRAPSEYKNIEPFEENDDSESMRNVGT